MDMGQIIKKLRLEKGLTQEELGNVIGVQKSAIRKYESGVVQNMKRSSVEKLANFFNVSPTYLMGLEDNKLNTKSLLIPVLGKIPAGTPLFANEDIIAYYPIIPDLYELSEVKNLFYLQVVGDSMNKLFENSSYVLMRKQDYAENGDIVAAIVNGNDEATLKRFKRIDDTFVMLEPDSTFEEYQPIIINLKETDFKIIGKVVGDFRKWS